MMAQIKLGQFLHKVTTAPVTAENPLHVQQAGSNALIQAGKITIASGDEEQPGGTLSVNKYRAVTWTAYALDAGHEFEIRIDSRNENGDLIAMFNTSEHSYEDRGMQLTIDEPLHEVRVRIKNNSLSQHEYSYELRGYM